jgi:hypothetical protein
LDEYWYDVSLDLDVKDKVRSRNMRRWEVEWRDVLIIMYGSVLECAFMNSSV